MSSAVFLKAKMKEEDEKNQWALASLL
jgi:hypothetical protein